MGKVKETLLCDDCGDAIIPESYEEVADDMLDFITDQVHWTKYYTLSICWGMLTAVFTVIFQIAPNKKKATEIILDALSEHTEEEIGDA